MGVNEHYLSALSPTSHSSGGVARGGHSGQLYRADAVGHQQCQNSSHLFPPWDINLCRNLPGFLVSLRWSPYSQSPLGPLLALDTVATSLELTPQTL